MSILYTALNKREYTLASKPQRAKINNVSECAFVYSYRIVFEKKSLNMRKSKPEAVK